MLRRALISVTDKSGVVELARGLRELGFELLSTGGTRRALLEAGIEATEVSALTGFPEILDGRVKTLHPLIHGGILGRLDRPADHEAMALHGIAPIEVVVVNLYAFAAASARFDPSAGPTGILDVVEEIDIGGPTLLRAAAKNHPFVLPVVDPADYPAVLAALAQPGGPTAEHRRAMAGKVFAHTAQYDTAVAAFFARVVAGPAEAAGATVASGPPSALELRAERVQALRYGENPHQSAALYGDFDRPPASLVGARQLGGKELSFNNLLDADAALQLALDLGGTSAVYVKHNNPCGVASGEVLAEVIRTAREVDPVSAFGAVIALTAPVDVASAAVLAETFVEVIVAPEFSPEAQSLLGAKKNLRLLALGPLGAPERRGFELRRVRGGWLYQSADVHASVSEESDRARTVTTREPTADERRALAFAWVVAKHVRSNAIVFARPGRVVAVGAGQMSRVDSVALARLKTREALQGAVVASDAFFPFRDGVDLLAEAGATAIIQPGGSVRDDEVIEAANAHGLAMLFTGVRHFRH